jgi:uncharacterized membrane protein HdeD (DUF308 family)
MEDRYMMAHYLYRNRWWFALRGVLAIVTGILAFIWPGVTAVALVYLFGAYALLDGILTIGSVVRNREENDRWWLGLLEGLVSIAAGAVAFLFPTLAAVTLLFVIAIWAILTGLLEIAAAIRLRREITNEWALGLGGLVSIALGVIMIVNPGAGLVGLVWAIGGYAVLFGILMLFLAIRAGRLAETEGMRV